MRSESSPSNYILKKRTKTTIIIQSISKQITKPISHQYSHATIRNLSKLIPQTRPSPSSKHNNKSTTRLQRAWRENWNRIHGEIKLFETEFCMRRMAHKIIALFKKKNEIYRTQPYGHIDLDICKWYKDGPW